MIDLALPFGTCFSAIEERKSGRVLRGLLLVYIIVNAFNFHANPPGPGSDPSWVFSLNYVVNSNLAFGRDVVSTCGPLGFLIWPQSICNNVTIALICRLSIWLIFSGMLCFGAVKRLFSLDQLFLLSIAMILCGGIGLDYFTGFLILFLLCFSLKLSTWLPCFLLAVLLTSALFFMKFTSALLALSAVLLFSFTLIFIDRKRGILQLSLSILLIPLLFTAWYLLYNPSLTDMFSYIKGSFEISSAYSVSMSLPGKWYEIYFASIFIVAYIYLIIKLYRSKQQLFWISLSFVPVLFLGFKHGFVRQDGHVIVFFSTSIFVFTLILLFSDLRITHLTLFKYIYPLLIAISFFVYQQHFHTMLLNRIFLITPFKNIVDLLTQSNLDKTALLKMDTLPETILANIAGNKVSIFPSEISYVAANNLNYSPLPVLPPYAANSCYLDKIDSDFLNGAKAPLYLLAGFESIDGRHCLVDDPSTWLSIYNWYEPCLSSESVLLLRRKQTPRFQNLAPVASAEFHKTETLRLPECSEPLLVKISLDLSLYGQMAKTFYKILPVKMAVTDDAGRVTVLRVVPDTLKNGILMNYLPQDLRELDLLLAGKAARKICSVEFLGKGLEMYRDKVSVEFIRIPGITISRFFEDLSFPDGTQRDPGKTTFRIESIEPGRAGKKSIVVRNERFISIGGWAVDEAAEDAGAGVWADIDGKSYPAVRCPRPEIAVRFNKQTCRNAGFTVDIPVSSLSPGHHELSLKLLAKNKLHFYQTEPIAVNVHVLK